MTTTTKGLSKELAEFHDIFWNGIPNEMSKHIVGADDFSKHLADDEVTVLGEGAGAFIQKLTLTLLAGSGHRPDKNAKEYHSNFLTEGGVGMGKTEILKTFTTLFEGATFQRIQFLADLKPSSIQITVKEREDGGIEYSPGLLSANIVLVEELTRSGDTTQNALIEAMAEGTVSHPNLSYQTPRPYMVIATANPRDARGVVGRLGTAVSDRFMIRIDPPHNTPAQRVEIMLGQEERAKKIVQQVASIEDILTARDHVFQDIHIDQHIAYQIEELTRLANERFASNEEEFDALKHGAEGERPSQWLVRMGKGSAFREGRAHVMPEDIKELAYPTLRHRIDLGSSMPNQRSAKREAIRGLVEEVFGE